MALVSPFYSKEIDYGGQFVDLGFGWQTHIPESLRGVCANLYDCGADGVYLFNFPCWIERLPARPYHWLDGLDTPSKPMLIAADHGRSRVAGVDRAAAIPAVLAPGESLTVPLYVAGSALPPWRALCLVHSGGDVTLAVNGVPADDERRPATPAGPYRSELFVEFINHYRRHVGRAKPEDCRVFRVDPSALRRGGNEFVFTNPTGEERQIERVNLGLW